MLVVYKEPGMISKDVSRWLQHRIAPTKMGHIGTLDPMAEGILPLLLGKATRLQDVLVDSEKEYRFEVTFGVETDTLDKDGQVLSKKEYSHVTSDALETIAEGLVGPYRQVPPIYSAVKYRGKPLYFYARSNRQDEVPLQDLAKSVDILEFEFLSYDAPRAMFRMVCSKGTYVRAIAKEIADRLETVGMVTKLMRTKSSGVTINDAKTLESIEKSLKDPQSLIVPVEDIPLNIPQWSVTDESSVARLRLGQKVSVDQKAFDRSIGGELGVESVGHGVMMLLDQFGGAIGLGESSPGASGRVSVSLRRGLR